MPETKRAVMPITSISPSPVVDVELVAVGGVDQHIIIKNNNIQQQGVITPSEKRLARWLRKHLAFAGAERFVRQYGPAIIMGNLKGFIVEWVGPGEVEVRRGYGRAGWRVRDGVRNPAGLLRWLVTER